MKDTALVLAGGGAKGAYQAEVARHVMNEKNITAITGVSAGALNGSMLAQNKAYRLSQIWENARKRDVWKGGHNPIRYFKMLMGWSLGLYNAKPLHNILKKNFDPNNIKIPFKAGAVSLKTGEYIPYEVRPEKEYNEESIQKSRRFIVASSAVPVGVEPVEIDGEKMIDGGTRNIAPVGDAIDENPDEIIAIFNTRRDNKFKKQEESPNHVFGIGEWALEILLNETVRSDIRIAKAINSFQKKHNFDKSKYDHIPINVIEPSKPIGKATDFSRDAWQTRIRVAKKDAEEYLT